MFTLHKGDCREYMKTLQPDSVDLVLADQPYPELKGGTKFMNGGVASRINESNSVGDIWNASLEWMDDAWRISKFGMMVFCTHHSVDTVKQKFRDNAIALITWVKRNTPNPVNNVPKYTTEFIWVFSKTSGLVWRNLSTHYDIPMLQAGCMATERILNKDGTTFHPTQKPELLIRQLLKCNPKSVIDPFMGTGTTGAACIQMDIDFIGCENDPKYFPAAEKRIKSAALQPGLFTPSNNRVHWTGGESPANLSLFPAEVIPPAKVTRKSPRQ